jgi:hypothetical protein
MLSDQRFLGLDIFSRLDILGGTMGTEGRFSIRVHNTSPIAGRAFEVHGTGWSRAWEIKNTVIPPLTLYGEVKCGVEAGHNNCRRTAYDFESILKDFGGTHSMRLFGISLPPILSLGCGWDTIASCQAKNSSSLFLVSACRTI